MTDMELIFTYEDLLLELLKLSTEQLQQRAQIVLYNELNYFAHVGQSIVCMGTVGDLDLHYVKSTKDGQHHSNEIVLLVDGNDYDGQQITTLA